MHETLTTHSKKGASCTVHVLFSPSLSAEDSLPCFLLYHRCADLGRIFDEQCCVLEVYKYLYDRYDSIVGPYRRHPIANGFI